MVVDQQSLLEDKARLDELHRSYDGEARLNESFIVLTVGASLIASLGLVADNNAVIIGAMVVAPWILPLRVAVSACPMVAVRRQARPRGATSVRRMLAVRSQVWVRLVSAPRGPVQGLPLPALVQPVLVPLPRVPQVQVPPLRVQVPLPRARQISVAWRRRRRPLRRPNL